MKEYTMEDIKIGSIWESTLARGYRYRIDKIEDTLLYSTLVECPNNGNLYLKVGNQYLDFFEVWTKFKKPVYTIEGFEV